MVIKDEWAMKLNTDWTFVDDSTKTDSSRTDKDETGIYDRIFGDSDFQKGWDAAKNSETKDFTGSDHYRTDGVEPIDLYKSGGIFRGYAISSIIKYAFRNRNGRVNPDDMDKVIHLAKELKEERGQEDETDDYQWSYTKGVKVPPDPWFPVDPPVGDR